MDDEELIIVLHDTKQTAEEVSKKLTVASETETKINTARCQFHKHFADITTILIKTLLIMTLPTTVVAYIDFTYNDFNYNIR